MASNPSSARSIEEEREYLENLLNTRFNYYLIFLSLLLVAAFGNDRLDQDVRGALLVSGAAVSAMIAYAVGRTHYLLEYLLTQLRSQKFRGHPYQLAFQHVADRHPFYARNANKIGR